MTPPAPKSGAETVPTVKRYTSEQIYWHQELVTVIEGISGVFVDEHDFDRQSAELAQARERIVEEFNRGKSAFQSSEIYHAKWMECQQELIALRAERGRAEVGGTEITSA